MKSSDLRIGLLAGASTGVFWGVPFVAPQILTAFSPVEIAFGRFFFFGLAGFVFFRRGAVLLRSLKPSEILQVLGLSASGFWLYSSLLFWSISRTDGVMASLVLGLLPVTIPMFSARAGVWATPGWRFAFYLGLGWIACGLAVLFRSPAAFQARDPFGVAGLFLCLALWTGFAIWNSRFLQQRPSVSRRDFSSLMGMVSLVCLAPLALSGFQAGSAPGELFGRSGFMAYAAVSAVLGLGSSWLANWLWNIASARLPSSISGTLLVFETVFGLLYTFIFQERWPHDFEIASIVLCLSGVALAIRAQITSWEWSTESSKRSARG